MNQLTPFILPYIGEDDIVLDVGSGVMNPTKGIKCRGYLAMDAYKRYLDEVKDICCTIQLYVKDLGLFPANSYDVVLALDLVEHLDKAESLIAINEMKRIARKRVVIFTPKTYHTNEENVPNVWDMGYNDLQMHRCVIFKEDLDKLGFIAGNLREAFPDMYLAVYSK